LLTEGAVLAIHIAMGRCLFIKNISFYLKYPWNETKTKNVLGFVSAGNNSLVGTLITIDDVTDIFAIRA